jgi:hypothetical protein
MITDDKRDSEIFKMIEEIVEKNVNTGEELFKFNYHDFLKPNARMELIEKLSLHHYKEEITKKLVPITEQIQFNNIKKVLANIKVEYRKYDLFNANFSKGYAEKKEYLMREFANNMVELYNIETLEKESIGRVSKKILDIEEVRVI